MIFGSYPCCNAPLALTLPDKKLPVIGWENCPECKVKVWHQYSRIDPMSWTDDEFQKLYIVNEEDYSIKKKVTQC